MIGNGNGHERRERMLNGGGKVSQVKKSLYRNVFFSSLLNVLFKTNKKALKFENYIIFQNNFEFPLIRLICFFV